MKEDNIEIELLRNITGTKIIDGVEYQVIEASQTNSIKSLKEEIPTVTYSDINGKEYDSAEYMIENKIDIYSINYKTETKEGFMKLAGMIYDLNKKGE